MAFASWPSWHLAPQDHEFLEAHDDMRRHGYFPDPAYYQLMRDLPALPQVRLAVTTRYESWWAFAAGPEFLA